MAKKNFWSFGFETTRISEGATGNVVKRKRNVSKESGKISVGIPKTDPARGGETLGKRGEILVGNFRRTKCGD